MNNAVNKIRKYNELKADINYFDIRLEEIEEEIIGISAQPQGEFTGKTYKINSQVEQQVDILIEKQEEFNIKKANAIRMIRKIDNAMNILTDEEREIIKVAVIERKRYWRLEEKLNLTYSRIKQIERDAIKKMEKYLL
ncbi:hypothetical protein HMPREF1084_01776 [Clostridium butyricum 60E.3]|uniref:sigma factor-like helix-turn-helix DNA-binding protein n=1 Tax=Clostridium butyricum TaxID=1492 RepID=UPI0002D1B5A7|nr:sigma factor-like helix-turn-helix DNA-binding protein [Clostridium butyricum]ENZ33308.1 hypothetical protein HMPREF1084_01776 [Clostridium butyricum 60E.3]MDU1340526.1 sigma factor-like helix-turn-helix DNA-binding protein [Clostridium butyricum]DAJ73794.1 MAG TPA: hypothetical protein [Caudoviricetes sp.]